MKMSREKRCRFVSGIKITLDTKTGEYWVELKDEFRVPVDDDFHLNFALLVEPACELCRGKGRLFNEVGILVECKDCSGTGSDE